MDSLRLPFALYERTAFDGLGAMCACPQAEASTPELCGGRNGPPATPRGPAL